MRALSIIIGIILAIGGFYCMLTPGATFYSLSWVLGFLLLISGIYAIIAYFYDRKSKVFFVSGWDLVTGIITVILALLIMFNSFAKVFTDFVLLYLFAIVIIVTGISRIIASIYVKRVFSIGWIWMLIFGILAVILGIYAFIHPAVSAFAIGLLIGLLIFVQGLNMIALGATVRRN